jgi:hypothetical protein
VLTPAHYGRVSLILVVTPAHHGRRNLFKSLLEPLEVPTRNLLEVQYGAYPALCAGESLSSKFAGTSRVEPNLEISSLTQVQALPVLHNDPTVGSYFEQTPADLRRMLFRGAPCLEGARLTELRKGLG